MSAMKWVRGLAAVDLDIMSPSERKEANNNKQGFNDSRMAWLTA